jgi:hypothetical protein
MKRYSIYVEHLEHGWSGDVGYVVAQTERAALKKAKGILSKKLYHVYGAERVDDLEELRLDYNRPLRAGKDIYRGTRYRY